MTANVCGILRIKKKCRKVPRTEDRKTIFRLACMRICVGVADGVRGPWGVDASNLKFLSFSKVIFMINF